MRAALALVLAGVLVAPASFAQILGDQSGIMGGEAGFLRPSGGVGAVTIDAMPFARTVTCSDYTLTGTAPGAGSVSWAASPSGASGACTGTTSWSCVVDVAPDAAGEGVEVITVSQSGATSDTETIGFYVDGEHSCFLAQSINGTYNSGMAHADPVATWVNLGSSALNVTQATGTAQPMYQTSVVNSQPAVTCDGNDRVAGAAAADWKFLSDGSDWTVEHVSGTTSANPNALYVLASTATALATSSIGFVIFGDDRAASAANDRSRVIIYNSTGIPITITSANDAWPSAEISLISAQLDDNGGAGDDAFQFCNGTDCGTAAAVAAYSGSNPNLALTICSLTGGLSPFNGRITRVSVYPSVLTSTQRDINEAVDAWALGGTPPVSTASADRWLFIGDSLTAGTADAGKWQDKLRSFVATANFTTNAVGGALTSEILDFWRASDSPSPAMVFVLGGTNDTAQGLSAASAFGNLTTIYLEAQALDVQVIASTIPPYGTASGAVWDVTKQVQVEALNDMIRGSPDVDIVVDLYALLGEPGSPEEFNALWVKADGVHPNDTGTTEMANIYATALGL